MGPIDVRPASNALPQSSHAAPGFAAALARVDVRQLPSIALGRMLDAYSVAATPASEPPLAVNGMDRVAGAGRSTLASIAPPSDEWGQAAGRPAVMANAVGEAVLAAGEAYLGVPYQWGGTDPSTGFDCSGFVQQVYADLGVSLPRVSIDQSRAGVAVNGLGDAQVGDLVFWRGEGSRPNHIGIYAGDGHMLVAPRTGDVVRYQQISRTPHEIRRIFT